jgi:hypothetical protein
MTGPPAPVALCELDEADPEPLELEPAFAEPDPDLLELEPTFAEPDPQPLERDPTLPEVDDELPESRSGGELDAGAPAPASQATKPATHNTAATRRSFIRLFPHRTRDRHSAPSVGSRSADDSMRD